MVVEVACECDGLPPHSHTGRWIVKVGFRKAEWEPDPYDIRVWIDWRIVAHDLMTDASAGRQTSDAS